MKIAIWFIAAIASYLVGAINLSIVLSKAVYHKDIRQLGSGNPGFTNFKRVFGGKLAWLVFAFDLIKGAAMCLLFSFCFASLGFDRQLGAAFAGLFVMLGHSYPAWYKFKGGKGFLVLLSELIVIDWRAGLIAFGVMAVLLLTVKYMSLSTMIGLTAGAILLFVFGCNLYASIIFSACALFMIVRHKENIKRLINGTESKFSLGSKKSESKENDKSKEAE